MPRLKYTHSSTLKTPPRRKAAVTKLVNDAKKFSQNGSLASISLTASTSVSIKVNEQSNDSLVKKKTGGRKSLSTASSKLNSSSRKSIGKSDDKPKNTIRSMFMKQIDKKKTDGCSQETSINESQDVVDATPTKNGGDILCVGNLHKRLTRRNSMTLQTPTKTNSQVDSTNVTGSSVQLSTPTSIQKRRRTMFTPAMKTTVIQEEISESPSDILTPTENIPIVNKTNHEPSAMEVCNDINPNDIDKCNNKPRQLLYDELPKTPSKSLQTLPDGKDVKRSNSAKKLAPTSPRLVLRRRTLYTPQPMDETNVKQSDITPIPNKLRRTTINFGATNTKSYAINKMPDLNDTTSCDAVLTPSNKVGGKKLIFPLNIYRLRMKKFENNLIFD